MNFSELLQKMNQLVVALNLHTQWCPRDDFSQAFLNKINDITTAVVGYSEIRSSSHPLYSEAVDTLFALLWGMKENFRDPLSDDEYFALLNLKNILMKQAMLLPRSPSYNWEIGISDFRDRELSLKLTQCTSRHSILMLLWPRSIIDIHMQRLIRSRCGHYPPRNILGRGSTE